MLEDYKVIDTEQQDSETLSPQVIDAYREIARRHAISDFKLDVKAIGGLGENSIGAVHKVLLIPTTTMQPNCPLYTILKIAPTSPARRAHMRVKDVYAREVFMYTSVFSEFAALAKEDNQTQFTIVPQMLHASLKDGAEFIIFQDLSETGFTINSRTNLPTYDLVVCAFRAIAHLHAMSFVLQAREPKKFAALVAQMDDNLFTKDMEEVSLEFGRKNVRRTEHMLQTDLDESGESTPQTREVLQALQKIRTKFHEICLDAVNGAASAPYAVICHGDFWNNNILYQFDFTREEGAIDAKLIDFQISRYSPPVLDLVHYLFCCTEKPLRDANFSEIMQIYYDTLSRFISDYQLDPKVLYPEAIFRQQIQKFGAYGFCMSALSVPFFVSNANELPNLDRVCEAIRELPSSSDSLDNVKETKDTIEDLKVQSYNKKAPSSEKQTAAELLDEFDPLTERTLPIFKRRMIGNARDLQKFEMIEAIMKY